MGCVRTWLRHRLTGEVNPVKSGGGGGMDGVAFAWFKTRVDDFTSHCVVFSPMSVRPATNLFPMLRARLIRDDGRRFFCSVLPREQRAASSPPGTAYLRRFLPPFPARCAAALCAAAVEFGTVRIRAPGQRHGGLFVVVQYQSNERRSAAASAARLKFSPIPLCLLIIRQDSSPSSPTDRT